MSRFTLSWLSTSAERYDEEYNRRIEAAVTDMGLAIVGTAGGTCLVGPEPRSDNSITVDTDITTASLLRNMLAKVIGQESENISLKEDDNLETVTLSLRIENTYEDGDEVITTVDDMVVPAPPVDDSSEAYREWADEHIRDLTGTGRTEGDAWYDVTITESSDPALVGRTFDWGY